MSQEELRRMLAQKEAEAAELQAQLAEAASLGQELLSQNESLKMRLHAQTLVVSPTPSELSLGSGLQSASVLVGGGTLRERLSVPALRRPSGRSVDSAKDVALHEDNSDNDSVRGSLLQSSRELVAERRRVGTALTLASSRRGSARSRLSTWEDWMAERSVLEDEHALLKKKCDQLEVQLYEQQDVVRDRANSLHSSRSGRSRGNSLMPSAQPAITEEVDQEAREDTERRQLEQHIRQQVESQVQEHIDELMFKVKESEAKVQGLDVELQHKTHELLEENERYKELLAEMTNRHTQAEKTLKNHRREQELDAMRKSATMMNDSIHNLSRRSSLANPSVGHARSIFEEVVDDGRNLDHLEQEHEELLQAVLQLRVELDAAQTQIEAVEKVKQEMEEELLGRPAQHAGGDVAAGRQCLPLTAAQRADAEAVISKLESVRIGIEEGQLQLRRRASTSQMQAHSPSPEEEGLWATLWEDGRIFALSCFCCTDHRRKHPDMPTSVAFSADPPLR